MEKMNLFEMQAIAGGISREEYCAELDAIMSDNWGKCKRLRVYTIVDFSFIRTFAPSF